MGTISHPKLACVALEDSFITGVIYDDVSLTLELDFRLKKDHPAYRSPPNGETTCFRSGFMRFAELDDFRISKADPKDGADIDYSDIYEATLDDDFVHIHSGWGEIELTARSIQIALD